MAAPPIPPATINPALLVFLLLAQRGAVLKAVHDGLPTTPNGLSPGEPWADGDTIVFIPKPLSN